MFLRRFLAELDTLRPRLTDWDHVNVDGLRYGSNGLELTIDETDTETALESAKEEIASLTQALKDQEEGAKREADEITALQTEIATLREEMAALKDPTEEGSTVLTYRDRAMQAETNAEAYRQSMHTAYKRLEEKDAELTAMRKRKGVEPGLMACAHDVWQFVQSVAGEPSRFDKTPADTVTRYREHAAKLRDKIASRV